MEEQNEKLKLTVEEQIQDMIEKNVQFTLYSKEDAKKFLKYNNYYFKLKSYARNYRKFTNKKVLQFRFCISCRTIKAGYVY